jgi:Zn-finger nucleic acid-binding protein
MKCPECSEQMKKITIGEDKISECPSCRGLWFEHGKLDAVKDEVLPNMEWLDIDAWKEQADFKARWEAYSCPRCEEIALTTIEDQKSKTEISTCWQCKGIWLTTGQFLYLVNALLEEVNQKSAPELIKISLQQTKEVLTNPDSTISEWESLKTSLELLKHRIYLDHPRLNSLMAALQKSLPL